MRKHNVAKPKVIGRTPKRSPMAVSLPFRVRRKPVPRFIEDIQIPPPPSPRAAQVAVAPQLPASSAPSNGLHPGPSPDDFVSSPDVVGGKALDDSLFFTRYAEKNESPLARKEGIWRKTAGLCEVVDSPTKGGRTDSHQEKGKRATISMSLFGVRQYSSYEGSPSDAPGKSMRPSGPSSSSAEDTCPNLSTIAASSLKLDDVHVKTFQGPNQPPNKSTLLFPSDADVDLLDLSSKIKLRCFPSDLSINSLGQSIVPPSPWTMLSVPASPSPSDSLRSDVSGLVQMVRSGMKGCVRGRPRKKGGAWVLSRFLLGPTRRKRSFESIKAVRRRRRRGVRVTAPRRADLPIWKSK